MGLSELTFWEWLAVCANFLLFGALSYWRIRDCIETYLEGRRLVVKIIIAVVCCVFTLLSTFLLFAQFRGNWCEGCQAYH